jgi:hypothetical protein
MVYICTLNFKDIFVHAPDLTNSLSKSTKEDFNVRMAFFKHISRYDPQAGF